MHLLYFNLFSIPPLVAGVLIIFFGVYVFSKNIKSTINLSWLLVCFYLFIWLISESFLISTRNIQWALFLTKIIYLGVTGIPITILYFSSKITKTLISKFEIPLLIALFVIPVFMAIKVNWIISGICDYFWGFYPKANEYHSIYLLFWGLTYVLALITLHNKIIALNNKPEERNRISFCFWPILIGGLIGPLDFLPKYGIGFYPIGYFCVPIIIGFITYAMIKHDLMDIRIVIRKGLAYSLLFAAITGIYLILIMIIEYLFRGMLGYHSIITSLILAFIIAIIFNPLRNKIQNLIDKIFFGKLPYEIAEENNLLKQELEQSERLKTASTLALGLAHEIKNPITTIKTFAEYLPDKLDDKDFLAKFAKLIPVETERINNIIQQLLKFSKPSAPKFQEVRIHQLIQETLSFLNNEFLKRKIKLSETYENRETTILADSEQIKQVLLNIIFNSMEAMPNGGTISIETKNNDDSVELSIHDTGCGIAKEDLEHIFDPFYSKKESGTGLGLAITHQIIKNHNGKIEVKSEINKGTKFQITFSINKK